MESAPFFFVYAGLRRNGSVGGPDGAASTCACVERARTDAAFRSVVIQFHRIAVRTAGALFPSEPPTALRILYPARSRGRSRPAPQADARSSQVWCPSHTASPGCTLWCAPVPANGRTLTAAAANCRSFRCHTESVRPTSRRYCPLDPTALCGFTQRLKPLSALLVQKHRKMRRSLRGRKK